MSGIYPKDNVESLGRGQRCHTCVWKDGLAAMRQGGQRDNEQLFSKFCKFSKAAKMEEEEQIRSHFPVVSQTGLLLTT